jgi:hypothetical protein
MVPPPHVATAETAFTGKYTETVVVDELQIRINGWWRILRIINGDNPPWAHLPLNHARPYPLPSQIGEEEMERISEQQNRLTLKWERDRTNKIDYKKVEREKKNTMGTNWKDEQYYRRRRERQNRRTLKRKHDRNERAQLQEVLAIEQDMMTRIVLC